MMEAGIWRTVSVKLYDESKDVLQSAVMDEVRVWRVRCYHTPKPGEGLEHFQDLYMATSVLTNHYRSLEALMASLQEPIEPNEP